MHGYSQKQRLLEARSTARQFNGNAIEMGLGKNSNSDTSKNSMLFDVLFAIVGLLAVTSLGWSIAQHVQINHLNEEIENLHKSELLQSEVITIVQTMFGIGTGFSLNKDQRPNENVKQLTYNVIQSLDKDDSSPLSTTNIQLIDAVITKGASKDIKNNLVAITANYDRITANQNKLTENTENINAIAYAVSCQNHYDDGVNMCTSQSYTHVQDDCDAGWKYHPGDPFHWKHGSSQAYLQPMNTLNSHLTCCNIAHKYDNNINPFIPNGGCCTGTYQCEPLPQPTTFDWPATTNNGVVVPTSAACVTTPGTTTSGGRCKANWEQYNYDYYCSVNRDSSGLVVDTPPENGENSIKNYNDNSNSAFAGECYIMPWKHQAILEPYATTAFGLFVPSTKECWLARVGSTDVSEIYALGNDHTWKLLNNVRNVINVALTEFNSGEGSGEGSGDQPADLYVIPMMQAPGPWLEQLPSALAMGPGSDVVLCLNNRPQGATSGLSFCKTDSDCGTHLHCVSTVVSNDGTTPSTSHTYGVCDIDCSSSPYLATAAIDILDMIYNPDFNRHGYFTNKITAVGIAKACSL